MFRTNYWHIYVLWLNILFNILLPILSLVILNIIILRYFLKKKKLIHFLYSVLISEKLRDT